MRLTKGTQEARFEKRPLQTQDRPKSARSEAARGLKAGHYENF
jgi:hypothetical protein